MLEYNWEEYDGAWLWHCRYPNGNFLTQAFLSGTLEIVAWRVTLEPDGRGN